MRKKILLLLICLLCFGCSKKEIKKPTKKEKTETKEVYIDNNPIPIGLYTLKTEGVLERVDKEEKVIESNKDIIFLQVFPSAEKQIKLTDDFPINFYNEWNKYDENHKYKIGFNINYKLSDGTTISDNILTPEDTTKHLEYIIAYLYDDYANRDKSWYSHIEQDDYNENTTFTSIKLYANGNFAQVISSIKLTIFTYDEDDFDENNEYRGKSKHTIEICNVDI